MNHIEYPLQGLIVKRLREAEPGKNLNRPVHHQNTCHQNKCSYAVQRIMYNLYSSLMIRSCNTTHTHRPAHAKIATQYKQRNKKRCNCNIKSSNICSNIATHFKQRQVKPTQCCPDNNHRRQPVKQNLPHAVI
ncbi:hypothetical protein D3C81_1860350 [compost metagenome]